MARPERSSPLLLAQIWAKKRAGLELLLLLGRSAGCRNAVSPDMAKDGRTVLVKSGKRRIPFGLSPSKHVGCLQSLLVHETTSYGAGDQQQVVLEYERPATTAAVAHYYRKIQLSLSMTSTDDETDARHIHYCDGWVDNLAPYFWCS